VLAFSGANIAAAFAPRLVIVVLPTESISQRARTLMMHTQFQTIRRARYPVVPNDTTQSQQKARTFFERRMSW